MVSRLGGMGNMGQWLTAKNCSIGREDLLIGEKLNAAADEGYPRVELWWPFGTPEPAAEEMDELVLSLIHISEPTRQCCTSRMPSSA